MGGKGMWSLENFLCPSFSGLCASPWNPLTPIDVPMCVVLQHCHHLTWSPLHWLWLFWEDDSFYKGSHTAASPKQLQYFLNDITCVNNLCWVLDPKLPFPGVHSNSLWLLDLLAKIKCSIFFYCRPSHLRTYFHLFNVVSHFSVRFSSFFHSCKLNI